MKRLRGMLILVAGLVCGAAQAHPLAPALLQLRETAPSVFEVTWRTSVSRVQRADVEPALPSHCRDLTPVQAVPAENESLTAHWTVDCGPQGLEGQTVTIRGLEHSAINVILRLERQSSPPLQTLLGPDQTHYTLEGATAGTALFGAYFVLGAEHLLAGTDHLLFILGLLWLVRGLRRLVWTVTAFTLGHSVTLALSTLDLIRVPQALAEAAIALTILLLACELACPARDTWMHRRPWAMAGSFGLIHGLGFAGALRDVGLPATELPLSLLGFNLGIEAGQLVLVIAVLGAVALGRRASAARVQTLAPVARQVGVYVIGALSAYWCLDRVGGLLA